MLASLDVVAVSIKRLCRPVRNLEAMCKPRFQEAWASGAMISVLSSTNRSSHPVWRNERHWTLTKYFLYDISFWTIYHSLTWWTVEQQWLQVTPGAFFWWPRLCGTGHPWRLICVSINPYADFPKAPFVTTAVVCGRDTPDASSQINHLRNIVNIANRYTQLQGWLDLYSALR